MKHRASSFLMVMVIVCLGACAPKTGTGVSGATGATGVQNYDQIAKGLLSTKTAIVGLAQTADSLCSAGIMKQAQCDEAKSIYQKSGKIYDSAVDALNIANVINTPAAWTNVQTISQSLSNVQTDLTALTAAFKK